VKPKIAFQRSAIAGVALMLAAAYGFYLVAEGRLASAPPASPRSLWISRQTQPEPRAVVIASLPALLAGFFWVSFSLSSRKAANAPGPRQPNAVD